MEFLMCSKSMTETLLFIVVQTFGTDFHIQTKDFFFNELNVIFGLILPDPRCIYLVYDVVSFYVRAYLIE